MTWQTARVTGSASRAVLQPLPASESRRADRTCGGHGVFMLNLLSSAITDCPLHDSGLYRASLTTAQAF
jgi:hypothetical protein